MATSAPKFSLSLSKKTSSSTSKQTPKPPTRPSLGRPKFHDSDDEDDTTEGVVQSVSHFDQAAGGAIDVNRVQDEKKGPLVIRGPGNRDWKEESRRKRQKGPLPDGVQQNGGEIIIEEPEKLQYGLSVGQTPREQPELPTQVPIRESQESEPKKVQTADEAAMDALLGNNTKSTLVLPGVDTEEEAFQRDYNHAPDMATLDEYAAVPVEEFGAALLRGMGWKDGDPIGKRRGEQPKKPRVMERRPALLGIGAKEDAAAGVELGSWGKPMKGRKKVEQVYTPVLLRNRVTGEQLTEEELKVKIEEQKKIQAGESRNIESRSLERSSKRSKYVEEYSDSDRRSRRSGERDPKPARADGRNRDRDYDRKDQDRGDGRNRDRDYDRKERDRRTEKNQDPDRSRRYRSSSPDSKSRRRDSRDRKRHSSRRDRSPSRDDRDRRRHGYDKKHRDRDAR